MLEQLKELLEMQRVLDETLMKEHGKTEYPLEETKIALFVELGEMMNELQTEFKWWKKHAIYNREKALEEYVDCLHFALSISNHTKLKKYIPYNECVENKKTFDIFNTIIMDLSLSYLRPFVLYNLFVLGNNLGFTWEEIYQAYKKKNEINYERLKGGY